MDSEVDQLHSSADALFARFQEGCDPTLIDEAIDLDRKALKLCPPDHPKRWTCLDQLQTHLSSRHKQTDIEQAIVFAREALDLCPPGHPDRLMSLNNVAIALADRYKELGDIADLDDAILLGQEALDLCPQEFSTRTLYLNNMSLYLSTRYAQLGRAADLDQSIVLAQEALDLCPEDPSDRSKCLNNIALSLTVRYQQLGDMADLNEAIELQREALHLFPARHMDRLTHLNNLSFALSTQYQQLGHVADLEEAIIMGREALDICPPGHPDKATLIDNVACHLSTRYRQLNVMADLDEAIILGQKSLDLRPKGHPDRSRSLNNVAVDLSVRYGQLGKLEDLDQAIILGRQALDLRPRGHPDRSMALTNLANYVFTRFEQSGGMEDLDESIKLGREALDLRPRGHTQRSTSLFNLSLHLFSRYNELGRMVDLDDAIVLTQESLDLRPPGHPGRSNPLASLICFFRTRFEHSNQSEDQDKLFDLCIESARVQEMVSSADLNATKAWVDAAEQFHHPTTILAYETTLRLLVHHLATLPSLPENLSILKQLASSLAVDAFSACLRSSHPEKAVELLEQGRGVFWNQVARLRSPLDDVIASGPEGEILADEFKQTTSHIRDTINSPGPDQHDQLCHLNYEMKGIAAKIRQLPGLERFLLPSLYSDLQRAATCGPVIIVNASRYSCDALVILVDRDPVHIPLNITKARVLDLSSKVRSLTFRAKIMDVKNDLGRILRELWDDVVSPIVGFLQTTLPVRSRIWWCPTAEFSLLPLHAAGPYRKGERNLAHLFVSSYTTTLAALIRVRQHNILNSAIKRVIGIGQANASGESELVSVGSELDIVGQRIGGAATFSRIEGPESNISRVSRELVQNEWVHFACHGLANRKDPFGSAFALHDGSFNVKHIMGLELENAEFAYLSACHTTVGDDQSPDEVIHLASAMQFAGFRSVIGTMWAVDDAETNKIASMFYDNMRDETGRLDYTRAAFALNKTMNALRIPLDQRILYVHIGA